MSGLYYSILLTSFLANSKPQCNTSNDTLDDNVMEDSITENADPMVETALSPHKTIEAQHTTTKLLPMATETPSGAVSLLDMPLEILFMIFDYTTCRDHLAGPDYLIRLKDTRRRCYKLVIPRPPMLLVSKSLQSALSHHFYTTYSFHAKITTRQLLEVAWDRGLTLQELDEILPYHLKLNTIRLTLEIASLTAGAFDFSILVNLGKKLFVDYEAMKLKSKEEIKLMDLDWRLVRTSRRRTFYSGQFSNLNLRFLLEEIHEMAFKAVSLGSHGLQEFGPLLERHLKKEEDSSSPTYRIRQILRQTWKHKRSVGRRVSTRKLVRPGERP